MRSCLLSVAAGLSMLAYAVPPAAAQGFGAHRLPGHREQPHGRARQSRQSAASREQEKGRHQDGLRPVQKLRRRRSENAEISEGRQNAMRRAGPVSETAIRRACEVLGNEHENLPGRREWRRQRAAAECRPQRRAGREHRRRQARAKSRAPCSTPCTGTCSRNDGSRARGPSPRRRFDRKLGRPLGAFLVTPLSSSCARRPADRLMAAIASMLVVDGDGFDRGRSALAGRETAFAVRDRHCRHARGGLHLERHSRPRPRCEKSSARARGQSPRAKSPRSKPSLFSCCFPWSVFAFCCSSIVSRSSPGSYRCSSSRFIRSRNASRIFRRSCWASHSPGAR